MNENIGAEHPMNEGNRVEHPTNEGNGMEHPEENQPGMTLPDNLTSNDMKNYQPLAMGVCGTTTRPRTSS